MVSLQHLAVLKLSETQRYEGDDPMIENVIFEADQLRHQTRDELIKHMTLKPRRVSLRFDIETYTTVMDHLSEELFDVFTYGEMIQTPEHVKWKEYFHTLYECVMIDNDVSFNLMASTLRYHDDLESERPPTLDTNDTCYHIVNRIDDAFKCIKVEQRKLAKQYDVRQDLKDCTKFGMKMLEWTNEFKVIQTKNGIYTRIIEWSMR